MSTRDSQGLRLAVRPVSAAVALALVAWSLSDDSSIGGGFGFGATQGFVLAVGLLVAASCFLPLAWNARALALVTSTAFSLLVAEVGLRLVVSGRYLGSSQYDERLIYRLVPGAMRESRREPINGGDRIVYRINSRGFRGEELREHPALRVVVYGDSFVQADSTSDGNTFAERLERYLADRLGVDVEVVNAGVAGYGPDQILRRMEGEVAGLAPDLVIVCLFVGNDFGDLVRNKLYRLDADGTLAENDVEIVDALRREMDVSRRELVLKKVIRDFVQGVELRLGVRVAPTAATESMTPRERLEYFLDRQVRAYEEFVVGGDNVVRSLGWDIYDADMSVMPDSEEARYKAALMDQIIGRIQAVASAVPVPLVLVPIPHAVDVGEHLTAEVDLEKHPEYRRRHLVEILEEIGTRRGIPVVDLFTPFQQQGTDALYFHGLDDHWNDRGQDVAAEVVTGFLLSNGLLDDVSKMATAGD